MISNSLSRAILSRRLITLWNKITGGNLQMSGIVPIFASSVSNEDDYGIESEQELEALLFHQGGG